MIKQQLIALLCMLAFACGTAYTTEADTRTSKTSIPLLPEVQTILELQQPDKQILKQDVYVGLMGVMAPRGTDYMELGAKVILNNFKRLEMAAHNPEIKKLPPVDTPELHIPYKQQLELNWNMNGETYQLPCFKLDNTQCIIQIQQEKGVIEQLLAKPDNQESMTRHLEVRKLPHFGVYFYSMLDPFPTYYGLPRVSQVRLAQAVLAFKDGRIDQGFNLLAEEKAAAHRMVTQDPMIIGKFVGISIYYTLLHTISTLIETPEMKPYLTDPRLTALLQPFTPIEQTAMAQAVKFERNWTIRDLYYTLNIDDIDLHEPGQRNTELSQLSEKNFDRHATVNLMYANWQPIIARASLTMDQVADLYAGGLLPELEMQREQAIKQEKERQNQIRNESPTYKGNAFGEVLLGVSSVPYWEEYLQRFYDLQTYIKLLELKQQILQKDIAANQIPSFIEQAGAAAQNPITRELFTWNAKTKTISTPWLAPRLPANARGKTEIEEDMPRNTVYLPSIQ